MTILLFGDRKQHAVHIQNVEKLFAAYYLEVQVKL